MNIRWQKHKRKLGAALTLSVCLIMLLWIMRLNHNQPLQYAQQTDVSLTAWIYSKPVSELLTDFQNEHPGIHIQLRTFRSEEQLHEELMAAISAHAPPHFAEIGSAYGIAELADTGALLPMDERMLQTIRGLIDPRYASAFQYNNQMWAMPYGTAVPVIYYNENLLGYSGLSFSTEAISWDQLVSIGMKLTQDHDGDEKTDVWGLVMDPETPWYLRSSISMQDPGSANRVERIYTLWHEMIYRYQITPPLKHHLAVSDFINGNAGLLLSSSEKEMMLEQYIGGTFKFGVLPFPAFSEEEAFEARVSGFVMLKSSVEMESAVRQIMAFLLSPAIQQRLLPEGSKLSILKGNEPNHDEKPFLSPRESAIQRLAARKLYVPATEKKSKKHWDQMLKTQEQLEASENVCISCLSEATVNTNKP